MRSFPFAALAALLLTSAPAWAQSSQTCGGFKWSVEREKTAFTGATLPDLKSGADYPGTFEAVKLALAPQSTLTYPVAPQRAPKSNPAYGAILNAPPLAEGGLYQLTMSGAGWVDLVQDGKTIRSQTYSSDPNCPGIRKSVRFKLERGPLTIEFSDVPTPLLNIDFLPAQ